MACVAAVQASRNFHWISTERVLVCQCWANVSTQLTGPGISQSSENLWNKITDLYQTSNPPAVQDASGQVTGEARQKSSLYNLFKRIGPLISCYISCLGFAEANQRSGESTTMTQKRAVDAYNEQHKKNWHLQEEYEVLKDLPRWLLDRLDHKKQADRTDGTDLNRPVQEALKRMTAATPTCANTAKPVGIKKARRNVAEGKIIDAEKVDEEVKLAAFMETFTKRAQQTDRAHQLELQKNEELAATTDALILFADVEGLSQETRDIIMLSKKHAKKRVIERCRIADEAAVFFEAEIEEEGATQLGVGSLV